MPAILCPRCHKLISDDEPQCPFCGQARPGLWGFTPWMRRLGGQVDFTRLIVWSCVALYVLGLLLDPRALFQSGGLANPLSLLAPSMEASFKCGMTGRVLLDAGHWWTVVTAIYLHGSLLHIFFNMMWVRQLAPLVEELFGPFRLFTIFTVSGVAGFVLSTFMGSAYTLGASGSIFGLLAAAIVYGRRVGSSMFTRQFLQWAIILFVFGLIFPRVDNWAHAGGFAGGYGAAYLFSREREREGLGAYLGAGLCFLLTIAAFALQLLTVLTL